jgi:phosphatidylglycerophosphatase A
VKGGLGVMIDDVIAGVFAAVVLGLALHLKS